MSDETKTKGHGPAFPTPIAVDPGSGVKFSAQYGLGGMTLRDYFAGQALTGLLAARRSSDDLEDLLELTYAIADDLIQIRDEEPV